MSAYKSRRKIKFDHYPPVQPAWNDRMEEEKKEFELKTPSPDTKR